MHSRLQVKCLREDESAGGLGGERCRCGAGTGAWGLWLGEDDNDDDDQGQEEKEEEVDDRLVPAPTRARV